MEILGEEPNIHAHVSIPSGAIFPPQPLIVAGQAEHNCRCCNMWLPRHGITQSRPSGISIARQSLQRVVNAVVVVEPRWHLGYSVRKTVDFWRLERTRRWKRAQR